MTDRQRLFKLADDVDHISSDLYDALRYVAEYGAAEAVHQLVDTLKKV